MDHVRGQPDQTEGDQQDGTEDDANDAPSVLGGGSNARHEENNRNAEEENGEEKDEDGQGSELSLAVGSRAAKCRADEEDCSRRRLATAAAER